MSLSANRCRRRGRPCPPPLPDSGAEPPDFMFAKTPLDAVVMAAYKVPAPPQNARRRLFLKVRPDGRLAFASCG